MVASDQEDGKLLAQWGAAACEDSFRILVARYAGLVHQSALRCTKDESLAREAAQNTFVLLARKAGSLAHHPCIGGWLQVTALNQARNLQRSQMREIHKRQRLSALAEPPSVEPGDDLKHELDLAIAELSAGDRQALLLRYYRALSFKEVAATLGVSVDAAQQRVTRATERLRVRFSMRMGESSALATGALLTGLAGDAQAGASLATALASHAIGHAAAGFSLTTSVASILMSYKTIAVVSSVVLVTSISIYRLTEASDKPVALSVAEARPKISTETVQPSGGEVQKQTAAKKINWAEFIRTKLSSRNHQQISTEDAQDILQRLASLSNEELAREMDEVTNLDISLAQKIELRQVLIDAMVKRDPMLVLNRLPEDRKKPILLVAMTGAFEAFLEKDPTGAQEWLQKQTDDGVLSSDSDVKPNRFLFEHSVLRHQLKSDPVVALRRVANFPESQKAMALYHAVDCKFSAAFDLAMDYYRKSGDDSLANSLMTSDPITQCVRLNQSVSMERMHQLADQLPNADARVAAHARLEEAAQLNSEGVPLELILEGQK